jgi:glycosyltransferase involved in cell wall biosynthesis
MKIAIDIGPLNSQHSIRGIGFHTKELLSAIGEVKHEFKDLDIYPIDFSKGDLAKYDLAHFSSFNPYFFSLPFQKLAKKNILTIHDLIYLAFPKKYPAGIKGKIRFFLQKFLIRKVDGIITISNTSKKDIVKFLNIDPVKVNVVYLAGKGKLKNVTDVKFLSLIKTKYKLPEKFVLYVGDINYNKNIPTLIKACTIAGVPLVVVGKQALDIEEGGITLKDIHGPMDWVRYVFGKPHPELAHYGLLLREFKKNNDIFRLGFVPDNDLAAIYSLATVYCQPSYYEGFGLPLLEAMVCRLPVVASKIRAHVEVAGQACLYSDPDKPGDFARKITLIFNNTKLRDEIINKGVLQAKKYSWKKSARETLKVYEKILRTD